MKKKNAIVITTINTPLILDNLGKNLVKYNHEDDTSIIIIGDKKTPKDIVSYCERIKKKYGIDIEYYGISEQKKTFAKHSKLLNLFPYNHPDRTILGHCLAYMDGYERTIALDDDNFPVDCDFIGHHAITGTTSTVSLIRNGLGWFNVHSALDEMNKIPFYPRGYPWSKRCDKANEKRMFKDKRKVIVNQGLVLEDPDVDAITRLFHPIRATSMNKTFSAQFGLFPGVWSPFNFQNTCLARELIPVYYRPLSTKRNADIWTAYLINRLAEHFGDVITFGYPLVKQIRNEHNLWDDLDVELINNRATDDFVSILRSIKIRGDTYFELLGSLLKQSSMHLKKTKTSTPESEMIKNYFREYKIWYEIIGEIVHDGKY